jgi:hypothetical protein
MMKIKHLAVLAALVAGASTGASASLTLYTDRAAFQAALTGGFSTENFNGVVGEPSFQTAPLAVGSLTLQGAGANQQDRNFIDQAPALFPEFNVDGSAFAHLLVNSSQGGSSVTIGFASSVFGFGADFAGMQDGLLRTELMVGSDVFTPAITATNTIRFLGFISDTAFSTVTLRSASANNGDGFGVDNVTFGNVETVPEPTGLALVVTALAGLGWATRRSKAR